MTRCALRASRREGVRLSSIPQMSDKPNVYEDNGRIIYRASALGGSLRCLVAARLGYEPMPTPAKMLPLFAAGHAAESVALDTLDRDGEWKTYAKETRDGEQVQVSLKVTEKIYVTGHIDAKAVNTKGKPRIVEVKSQSQGEWDAYTDDWEHGLFPRYRWQVSTYMHAEGLPLLLVRINRDNNKISVHYVDEAPYSVADIRKRVLQVEAQAATGTLPSDNCSDYPCPFFYLHDDIERIELEDPQVEVLAREYKEAIKNEKAAKEKKKVTFGALRLAAGGERKVQTAGGWKVTFFDAKNPQKSLQVAPGPECLAVGYALAVVEARKVPTYSERVRITAPPGEES